MKSILSLFLCFLFVGLMGQSAVAQERENEEARVSPNAAVSQTIGTTEVTVTYGRPGVRDREIFGGLEAYGEVWRTGANEATTITFSNDVRVEGESLPAGTYGLFTIPNENNWTIIFNNVVNQWGAFDYDESEDVLRTDVTPEQASSMEQMMIYFENVTDTSGDLIIHWSDTKVPVTIEATN